MLRKLRASMSKPLHERKVPMHMRGDRISEDLYRAVKKVIRENKAFPMYANREIARHFNIGTDTFQRIKRAKNFKALKRKGTTMYQAQLVKGKEGYFVRLVAAKNPSEPMFTSETYATKWNARRSAKKVAKMFNVQYVEVN